jgi:hypothetical protein
MLYYLWIKPQGWIIRDIVEICAYATTYSVY